MRIAKTFIVVVIALIVVSGLYAYLGATGSLGRHQSPGQVSQVVIPAAQRKEQAENVRHAARNLDISADKQILFGDLHVHSTFSNDAYTGSLPMLGGEGAHPPADACDFVRYCSGLDFWSINDHAVSLSSERWRETRDSIRQCNAVTDAQNPDTVAFLGFEWTQADSANVSNHWGHKNVIYRYTEDDKVAPRPIYAETELGPAAFNPPLLQRAVLSLINFPDDQPYLDYARYLKEMESESLCPKGVASNLLAADCKEGAKTPAELFQKLDEGGYESIVIPHGNTWGLYTPPETSWDKQLVGRNQDDRRQILIEVFSGHGNSEEYRSWRTKTRDSAGKPVCPPVSADILPVCQQAGRIIEKRCLAAGESVSECAQRAAQARQNAVESLFPMATVPDTDVEDWLDSEQCRDCFLPSYNYRPGGSSQYALAIGNFDDPDKVRRFRFGFMASSDNHSARGGTGYKEINRIRNVESFTFLDKRVRNFIDRKNPGPLPYSIPIPQRDIRDQSLALPLLERGTAFFLTGGYIAVHATARDRDSIWGALQRKEVYGTSGDRILLWFDLINPDASDPHKTAPMGSEVSMAHTPRFRVSAAGAFKQKPGCPSFAVKAVGTQRLQRLCSNECYHPSDERKLITRIEVVRIRPQQSPAEKVEDLIEDVWLVHECAADRNGCSFEFEDSEFSAMGRETVYYARVIEEPSQAVNADPLRCAYNALGECISVNHCARNNKRLDDTDDCLAEIEERAWSSPIFVDYAG